LIFFQPAEGKLCKFLNIYAAWEPGSEYDLDTIARKSRNQNDRNLFLCYSKTSKIYVLCWLVLKN